MVYNIFNDIAGLIQHNPYLITFLVALISEELLVFLAILSGRGMISFWIVYFIGTLAVIIFDSSIFLIGKSKFGKYIENKFFPEKQMDEKIKFVNKKSSMIYLMITKFVWGTRVPSIFYYSVRGMKYKRFLVYDIISLLVWSSIMLSAGWLAGKGFDKLLTLLKGSEKLFAILFLTALIVYVLYWLIKKIIAKEYKYIKRY
ncbi:MAG: hypothetical protein AABX54_02480 [Nanoarchaeota archaeon]